jgi:flagellar biosynthetic protein FlhB
MAEDQDDSQKTEQPTPKKLQDARDKGQVPSSREVNNLFILAVGTLVIAIAGPYASGDIKRTLAPFVTQAASMPAGPDAIGEKLTSVIIDVGLVLALPLFGFIVAAIGAGAIQNAIVWSTHNLQPKFERISPLAGFKRLFSLKSIVEFIKSLLKIVVVGAACGLLLWPELNDITSASERSTLGWLSLFNDLLVSVMITATVIVAVFAALDYSYQHFEFIKQMRMSLQEIKDEYKQTDGDPMIKQRLRQLRMEKASQRMMAEVPNATVVVTNPTHYSVALKYERGHMAAPVIVAMGVDELALRIRQIARDHDVPIYENPPLARALHATGEIDKAIPVEHYQAVAEVIGYVMRLAENRRHRSHD